MKKTMKFLLLLMTGVIMMTGCGDSSSKAEETTKSESTESEKLQEIKERGYILIGGHGTAPFCYIDTETGEYLGIDGEITKAVCKKLGIDDVRLYQTDFANSLLELQSGNCDVVSTGMYVTEKRQETVNFCNKYYREAEGIMALSSKNYTDISQISSIALEAGTGWLDVANELKESGIIDEVMEFPKIEDAVAAVEAGQADAIMADNVALAFLIKNGNKDMELLECYEPKYEGEIAAAFLKEDEEFLEEWNAALDELKEEGVIEEILEKYGLNEEFYLDVEEGKTINP